MGHEKRLCLLVLLDTAKVPLHRGYMNYMNFFKVLKEAEMCLRFEIGTTQSFGNQRWPMKHYYLRQSTHLVGDSYYCCLLWNGDISSS